MTKATERDYFTVAEAAGMLDVSPSTVWRWIKAQKLPAYRVADHTIRVKKVDLEGIIRPVREEVSMKQERTAGKPPAIGMNEAQDIWAGYDPNKVRQALKQSAGALAGVDRERLLTDLHASRQQVSQGRPE